MGGSAVRNWKTTLQSVLTVLIAIGTYCAVTPGQVIPQHIAQYVFFGTGLAKMLLGLTQKDGQGPPPTATA